MKGKISVLLLGIYHFDNPSRDIANIRADDILSAERQAQLSELISILAAYRPGKIFVEWRSSRQRLLDVKYKRWSVAMPGRERNEIVQLAFPLAAKLRLRRLYAVDAPGKFDYRRMRRFAARNGQIRMIERLEKQLRSFAADYNRRLKKAKLRPYLRDLNRPSLVAETHSFYNETMLSVGNARCRPGVDLVADWYRRNLIIYHNMLSALTGKEERILLIIGLGHIHLLRQFFGDNGRFRLEDAGDWL